MIPDTGNSTSIYTDIHSFTSLRAQAQANPNEALDQVAAQFESIFVQMMMKSMRDASEPLESGLVSSNQMESYEQMFDQQLSLDLSNGGGLGLKDVIIQQLGGGYESKKPGSETPASAELADHLNNREGVSNHSTNSLAEYWNRVVSNIRESISGSEPVSGVELNDTDVRPSNSSTNTEPVDLLSKPRDIGLVEFKDQNWMPNSPKEFVESLWDLAADASKALGVNPGVILAQAALETGWGKHVLRNLDGSNSFNLFGIKASGDWSGSEAQVQTLEYVDGIAERQLASFRSYDSLADSFKDYVRFLTQSPRYEEALQNAANDQQYVHGLQKGGYATDPNYAEKILSILSRNEFKETGKAAKEPDLNTSSAAESLKNSPDVPLS